MTALADPCMKTNWLLQCVKHSLPEQRETCFPVALSLNELEFVDKALGHPVRVAHGESSKHSFFVSRQSFGKALHFSNATLSNQLLPMF